MAERESGGRTEIPYAEGTDAEIAARLHARIGEVASLLEWCEQNHTAVNHAEIRLLLGIPAPARVQS